MSEQSSAAKQRDIADRLLGARIVAYGQSVDGTLHLDFEHRGTDDDSGLLSLSPRLRLLSNYPSTGTAAERKAARALARNKARIEKAKYGTPSHATLERRRRRKARPKL